MGAIRTSWGRDTSWRMAAARRDSWGLDMCYWELEAFGPRHVEAPAYLVAQGTWELPGKQPAVVRATQLNKETTSALEVRLPSRNIIHLG